MVAAPPVGGLATSLLESLWSRGDEAPLRAIAAPAFTFQLSSANPPVDLEGYCALVAGFRAAFDPIDLLVHKVLEGDDRVVVHYSLTGDHVGPFMGFEATRAPLWVPAMTFMYFGDHAGARVLERQASLTDFLSVQRQLREAS